jgi:hypothetical protein
MILFYAFLVYFLSFVIVLTFSVVEIHKDIKKDPGLFTWRVLIGSLLYCLTPVVNTIEAVVIMYEQFLLRVSKHIDEPVFKSKRS